VAAADIKKWAAGQAEPAPLPRKLPIAPKGEAALPKPWGVLYARPNPDGNRKACGNCFMWAKTERCWIHAPGLKVPADAVCGYHVFGPPSDARPEIELLAPVDPAYSGLEVVEGGTSCDVCRYYETETPSSGRCHAVRDDVGAFAEVEAMGCCARFEGKK
jgi:hypothetical protein